MNTNIPITVRERVPTVPEEYSVISHNTDYTVTFDFDGDWTAKYKTVYFVGESGEYTPVVMEGNTCAVPEVKGDCRYLFIGVQEGTAEKPGVLKTSRACCLKIRDSITDMIGAPIADPEPSVYEQIIAMLEKITAPTWSDVKNKPFSAIGDGLSVDEAGVLSAQGGSGGTPNAVQYIEQSLTDEQKAQARTNIGAGTSSFSGSYNDLTDKPTIPEGYTLPVATSDVLGGVKPAAKTDAMTSAVGVDADGKLWSAAGGGKTWRKICDIALDDEDANVASIIVTALPDGTSLEGLGITEIVFAGSEKIAEAASYSFGMFFVNDKGIIIGQNFSVNTTNTSWFRGEFALIGDGHARCVWTDSPSASSDVKGGGIIINPHYYGANTPDIADGYTDTEIRKITVSAPKATSGTTDNFASGRLVVYGR